jgi:hypothetical protein
VLKELLAKYSGDDGYEYKKDKTLLQNMRKNNPSLQNRTDTDRIIFILNAMISLKRSDEVELA